MIKRYCDCCDAEITKSNAVDGDLNRLRGEVRKPSGSVLLRVEVIVARDSVWNDGDFCKHCVLDALYIADDRRTPAAKAALDEMESEQEEWVELPRGGSVVAGVRIGADGLRPQYKPYGGERTAAGNGESPIFVAYRTGLEQGKKLAALSPETPNAPESDAKDVADDNEWVYLGIGIYGKGLRISRDGQRLEVEFLDGSWHTANDHYRAADGYRAGLRVRDEAVRELVEAVEGMPDMSFRLPVPPDYRTSSAITEPEIHGDVSAILKWVERIGAAVGRVKL